MSLKRRIHNIKWRANQARRVPYEGTGDYLDMIFIVYDSQKQDGTIDTSLQLLG